MKVTIIGGGPSGLATLKFLLHAHEYFPIEPIEARLFEADSEIGGTFVQRVYEDAELVSSKYLTAFSDFRLPRNAPDFVTPQAYVQYLRDYVTHFQLWSAIHLNTRVERVRHMPHGYGHVVRTRDAQGDAEEWTCDAVAICSGLHLNPRTPFIKGMDKVPVVLHSSQFKKRSQLGKFTNVVVLGAGETAMDIAHLAVTSPTKSVTLCHRGGFFCAPKIIPLPRASSLEEARLNKPVDTSIASLFDTAYAHPVLQNSSLLWYAYDQWIKKMHTLISGTEEGPDQWVGHMSKERKHVDAVFLVKSARALPYISAGHRSESTWNKIRSSLLNVPIQNVGNRKIDVMSWPEEVDDNGMMTVHNEDRTVTNTFRPDLFVLATGYDNKFPFLDHGYPDLFEANVRCVYHENHVDVGYIGFVRPGIGAIPPLAELQAQFWVLRLLQAHFPKEVPRSLSNNAVEPYEMDWKLHARAGYDLFAVKRGVDHESYAYQLALDMGSAPTMSFVFSKGWKVFFTWAMGSNFNPKFRMVGPWKWEDGATEIMSTELFDVVKKSGGYVYLATYTIIPLFVFGTISLVLYAVTGIARLFKSAAMIASKPFRR